MEVVGDSDICLGGWKLIQSREDMLEAQHKAARIGKRLEMPRKYHIRKADRGLLASAVVFFISN